ncbi:ribosomal protein S18 acetylase RimI-like enzyme [Streptomonospora salina]|uniref:Ribosomal protein S18 acetylase RimI-like enzyme n=1 Tax=Streptomonospora salina TaxID=104205 RepID=A0A841EBA4_9ACTN|nr:GNAT family N-acetyltransferase [Streptomonospora salina]MBB6001347.1 ribosomal protein S18 acetylase RimI-like enzyme [Streptomonospora salina]
MTLPIRVAGPEDLDALIGLRIESETWLHAAGIQQWTNRERGIRNLREGVDAGVTYVVGNDSVVVATLTLNGPDPDFWTAEDDPESALYLYKLMITGTHRGTGLGDKLMDWACAQAEERGKQWLRLDCWRDNLALQDYYQRRGFDHVRTVEVEGRGSGALFQRPAALRTADAEMACLADQ